MQRDLLLPLSCDTLHCAWRWVDALPQGALLQGDYAVVSA
ncbi:hypothetical protein CP97_14812 [Aurantiacibacter atlanticus]|uniref:Uncharacterized protein n=1 Tax=Aurantiacibacter atlanticus TaxID=1648404 RepID=A0A168M2X6_9SPHN|nr:hypothetical protein CP97_14812 [Aurantiacibacter atlanticus]